MIDEVIGIDSTSAATRKAEANTLLTPAILQNRL